MGEFDYDLGVIGGGSAGLTVASGAAQLGAKTLLIERESRLGGDCLHYGCVPSKTLIQSARIYHQMKRADRYGLPVVSPDPVDFKAIAARIKNVIEAIQPHDSEERFCSLGVRVVFGRASFVDPHTVEADGRSHSAAKWLIATGSSPGAPPVPGLAETGYLTNREIFYMDRLPRSWIILGGGPIAVEMAQAFSRLGCDVHVVQRSAQILSKEDTDMAAMVQQVLAEEGVAFHTGASLKEVRSGGGMKEVVFEQGENQITLGAEEILVCLGRKPNLDGMNLDGIGVEYGKKGLLLDERLRTSQKHIWGAGDITGDYQFTHAAGYEGGIVLANAVFRLPRKVSYAHLPWATYCQPELASVGYNEKRARAEGLEYTLWEESFGDSDRALAEGEAVGKVKMLLDAKERPLGVQILGPSAGELLSEWVAVFNGGLKLSTLASAVHPYPSLAEINKKVAGQVMSKKLFSDKIKKGLKLFFSLRGRACGIGEETISDA